MMAKRLMKKSRPAGMKKRLLSLAMALSLMLGMVPAISADQSDIQLQASKQISSQWAGDTAYYKADGNKGSSSDWAVKLSRQLTATGTENLFDVTMTVEVKDGETSINSKDAAVSLVLDTSGSMGYCSECGSTTSHKQESSYEWKRECDRVPGSYWIDEEGGRHGGGDNRCDICGGRYYNDHTEVRVQVAEGHAFSTRLSAAKEAMVSFLNAYAKDENGNFYTSDRMVSLVTFASSSTSWDLSSARGNQYWVNVNNQEALDYVIDNVIYGSRGYFGDKISASGGTNTDAGLQDAAKLLNTGYYSDEIGKISNRYCIILTDGEPTENSRGYTSGYGYSCQIGDTYAAQLSAAEVTSTGAGLYSIAYGLSEKTVPAKKTQYGEQSNVKVIEKDSNGNVTGGWLKEYCGSTAVYDAKNSESLNAAFNEILTDTNQSSTSTSMVSSTVGEVIYIDPKTNQRAYAYTLMGFMNGSEMLNTFNGASVAGNGFNWDLNNAQSTHSDSTKSTTYTLTYRVRLNNQTQGFQDWDTNSTEYSVGDASLAFTHTDFDGNTTKPTVAFPTVKAHGYLADLSGLTKVSYHNNQPLPGAVFQLDSQANTALGMAQDAIHREGASDTNGTVSFKVDNTENIPSGYVYTLTEKSAPEDYDKDNSFSKTITVAYGDVAGLENSTTVRNKLKQTTTDVNITKQWVKTSDMSIQPITVNVYRADAQSGDSSHSTPALYGSFTANGTTVSNKTSSLSGVTIEASQNSDNYTYTLKGLPSNIPETGGTWTYSVTEESVNGYSTEVNGLIITNTATGTTSYTVEKQWILPEGVEWPEVTVTLLQNGTEYDKVTLSKDNNWQHTFDNLPKYGGTPFGEYDYTVQESFDTTKYERVDVQTSGNSTTFVNTVKTDATTEKPVTKNWYDNGQDRPDRIEVQLYQNNVAYGKPVTLIASGDGQNVTVSGNSWTYTFTNLPRYEVTKDSDGKVTAVEEYTYTVKEVGTIEGYHSEASGLTIDNTRQENGQLTVSKEWADDFSSHSSVTIEVYQKSANVSNHLYNTLTVSESETITVPLYDQQGKPYTYTVLETNEPEGYEVSYSNNGTAVFTEGADGMTGSVTVTNTLNTDDTTVTYTVKKVWQQPDDLDTPELEIELYQIKEDGTESLYGTYTLPENESRLQIPNLPKYYYEQVMENREPTGDTVQKEYSYRAEETCPENYVEGTPDYGDDGLSVTFTNTITGTVKVTLNKSWQDSADPENRGTAVITVKRYVLDQAGGRVEDTAWSREWTVNSASTNDTFAQYDSEGNLYHYYAAETTVPAGYTSSGGTADKDDTKDFEFSFVNTLNDNGTNHYVTKNWVDGSDATKRSSITVELKQDNSLFASVTVNTNGSYTVTSDKTNLSDSGYSNSDVSVELDGNAWKITFQNLPAYNADRTVKYTYTADETAAPSRYEKVVSNGSGTTTITNTLLQDSTYSLSFVKQWVDPDGMTHPSVTFQLAASHNDAEDTTNYSQTVTLGYNSGDTAPTNDGASATSDTWEYTFENLPRYTENRYPITYSISEVTTLANYDQEDLIQNGVYAFKNTLEQDYVSASVTKTWDNSYTGYLPEEQQPEAEADLEVYVQLYRQVANGQPEAVGEKVLLNAENDWTHDFGSNLEKYDGNRQEYTYFVRELYENEQGNTWILVNDGEKVQVNGREYEADYSDIENNGSFSTTIENTFVNPQDYYYQVVRTYDTYVSGAIQESRQVIITGSVNISDESTTVNVNANDYVTYAENGVTSDTYTFVQGRINQNNGTSVTEGEFQTGASFSQALENTNTLYVFDLYYRLDLYKLSVNYVFKNGSKPDGQFMDYVDAGKYKDGDNYTSTYLAAPTGYKLSDITVKNGSEEPQSVFAADPTFGGGTFGSADILVTYYYERDYGGTPEVPATPDVTDPKVIVTKVDDAGKAITNNPATFSLYTDAACNEESMVAGFSGKTNDNGQLIIQASDLLPKPSNAVEGQEHTATFYLKETAAPEGYKIPDGGADVYAISVKYVYTEVLQNDVFVKTDTWSIGVNKMNDDDATLSTSDVNLSVTNERTYGYLEIEKTVTGLQQNEYLTYTFDANGPEGYRQTGVTVEGNGTESTVIKVPTGNYTISEVNANTSAISQYSMVTSYSVNGQTGNSVQVTANNTEANPAKVTVTNAYTYNNPETNYKTISGSKVWSDDNNRDGLRPASIRVQLYVDGKAMTGKWVDVAVSGNGTYSFSYDSYLNRGDATVKEIGYTDSEGNYHEGIPAGYTSTDGSYFNSYTVTNTHEPAQYKGLIMVEKEWASGSPQEVTLRLYANGVAVDGAVVVLDGTVDSVETEAWKATFPGTFYKYENGNLIDYSVVEDSLGDRWSYNVTKTAVTDAESNDGIAFKVTNSYHSGGGSVDYYKVTVNYYDKDTGDKIATSYVSDPIRENSNYDVTAYDAIAIEGYAYDSTTGDALTGRMNSDKVINVWYVADETDIEEPDVPGGELPVDPGDPGIDIEDPDVPTSEIPATGDTLMAWIAAAAVSGMGLIWLAITGKKRKDEKEG